MHTILAVVLTTTSNTRACEMGWQLCGGIELHHAPGRPMAPSERVKQR